MMRSADQAYYEVMKARFVQLCDAAALAADVTVEVEFSGGSSTMKHNRAIADRWVANAAAYGIADEGHRPDRRAQPTWATCRGSSRRSTQTSRSPTSRRAGTRPSSATPPRALRGPGRALAASLVATATRGISANYQCGSARRHRDANFAPPRKLNATQ